MPIWPGSPRPSPAKRGRGEPGTDLGHEALGSEESAAMFGSAQCRCLGLSAALLCAGCSMVPDYQRPASTLPEGFKEAPGWRPAAPADDRPRAEWWTWLADPELDALQARVLVSNQNLAAATAAYD